MIVTSLSPDLHRAYMRAARAIVVVKPTLTVSEAQTYLLEGFGYLHATHGEAETIKALEVVAERSEAEAVLHVAR